MYHLYKVLCYSLLKREHLINSAVNEIKQLFSLSIPKNMKVQNMKHYIRYQKCTHHQLTIEKDESLNHYVKTLQKHLSHYINLWIGIIAKLGFRINS